MPKSSAAVQKKGSVSRIAEWPLPQKWGALSTSRPAPLFGASHWHRPTPKEEESLEYPIFWKHAACRSGKKKRASQFACAYRARCAKQIWEDSLTTATLCQRGGLDTQRGHHASPLATSAASSPTKTPTATGNHPKTPAVYCPASSSQRIRQERTSTTATQTIQT